MNDSGCVNDANCHGQLEATSLIATQRMWIAAGICFAASVVLGLLSDGCYHDDDLTHYLMARWAWWYPSYLLHIWGRPGLTVPLAAVSWIGDRFFAWHVARVLSAVATTAGAVLAAKLAMRWGIRRGWLVVIACFAQPLNMLLSFTTLSENWTALYLIGAVYLLDRHRAAWASAVFSVALVSRHEAVVFIPIWWAGLFLAGITPRRFIFSAAISLWAPAVHNLLFYATFEEWPVRMYFQPSGSTEFLPTGPLAYVPNVIHAISPAIIAWAIVGLRPFASRRRCLVIVFPVLFVLLHAAIKAIGVYASGGYGRFLVAVFPFVGMLAAAGIERILAGGANGRIWATLAAVVVVAWLAAEVESRAGRLSFERQNWLLFVRIGGVAIVALCMAMYSVSRRVGHSSQFAGRAIIVPLFLLLIQLAIVVRPLVMNDDQRRCREVADWLSQEGRENRPVFATNPWIVYQRGMVEHPRAHKGRRLLASMPIGTLVVWDSKYTESDFHGIKIAELGTGAYQAIRLFPSSRDARAIVIGIAEKVAETPLDNVADQSIYPPALTASKTPVLGIYYSQDQ